MLQFASLTTFASALAAQPETACAGERGVSPGETGFVATHFSVGAAPFAALPVLLAFGVAPTTAGVVAFAWLTAPILIALAVSRGAPLERAQIMSAAAFAALAALVAGADGGIASYAAPWLALPVIEAALFGARRTLIGALAASAAAALGLAVLTGLGALPTPVADPALGLAGSLAAGAYAVAIAVRAGLATGASDRSARASAARFELFAASVSDVVTRHDAGGGATFVSSSAAKILGAPPRELHAQGLIARVNVADRPAFLRTLAAGGQSDEPAVCEIRMRRGAGSADHAWLEMRARRVRPHEADEADAAASPVVCSFRDVTDRKAHEEALVAAREEAERANLLKTRFLANMSHELRTPLNAIIGFSEILSDEKLCRLAPERRADYAALIHASGAHLLDVVNSVLDMAKLESGAFSILPEPCEIDPIARHCASLMALKAESAGVRMTLDVSADVPVIEADRRAVTQILINLVANAIKFTPRGGEVAIDVRARNEGAAIVVRDTGVGIAPEHLGRVGEAFFQADPSLGRRHEGSGLGLSVVRGLVGLHGGEVAVESALGQGTVVTVYLPLESARAGREARAARVAA